MVERQSKGKKKRVANNTPFNIVDYYYYEKKTGGREGTEVMLNEFERNKEQFSLILRVNLLLKS